MLPRNKIFVGSLPQSTKPEEVRRLFENYGVVTECDVMNRCAFVHMQTPDMMDNAIQALHNSEFKGVTINVEKGRTKERAPGGGGSDGGESGGRGGFRGGRGGFNQQNRPNYDGGDGDRSGGPMRNNRGNMRNQPYGSGGGGGGGGAGRGGSFDGQNQGGSGGGGYRGGRGGGDYNSDRGSGGRGGGGYNNSGGSGGGSRFSGGQQSEDRRGFALPNDSAADRFSSSRPPLAMSSFKDPFVRRSIGDVPAGPSAPYVNRGIYSQGNAAPAPTQASASYNQAFPPLGSDESRNASRGPQQQRWTPQ